MSPTLSRGAEWLAIPKSVPSAEAPAYGRTIRQTGRTTKGAAAHREVARRLLETFG